MKFLDATKQKKKGRMRKYEEYLPAYDFHFEKNQNRPLRLLEIGVQNGGSLFAWQAYFPQAEITGIDIDPACKQFEQDNIKVCIGDQADAAFLQSVNDTAGPYDIVIDDGGHTMNQQIVSFRTLFPLLTDDGWYVIEDVHTSYWPDFFDGEKKTMTMLKDLIDGLNFGALESPRSKEFRIEKDKRSYFSGNIVSLHFYNGIVFIQKGKNQEGKIYKV